MKQGRNLFLAALAAGLVLLSGGQVLAAPEPEQPAPMAATSTSPISPRNAIGREIHVKAKVLGHRDIIVDLSGNISKIISNTPQDVTPTVYSLDTVPENQLPLTDELLQQYRRLVPAGTARYGVIYDRQSAVARTSVITSIVSTPSNTPALTLATTSSDTTVRDLLMAVK